MTRRRNRKLPSCFMERKCPPGAFSLSFMAPGGYFFSALAFVLLFCAVSCRPSTGAGQQNHSRPWLCEREGPSRQVGRDERCARSFAPQPLLTADGKDVTDWMMGTSRLYPSEFAPLPKPPAGYKPVHISHYGRHGSRYIADLGKYTTVYSVLEKAAAGNMLTPAGERVWNAYSPVYPLFNKREGELTPVGAAQHQGIARRMVERFPALFRGRSRIEANSTNLERTMLSMQYFTGELLSMRPRLDIHADASRSYMGCINQHTLENPKATDYDIRWKTGEGLWLPAFEEYVAGLIDPEPFSKRLFADYDYLCKLCDPLLFERLFYEVAVSLPNCGCASILDAFTSDELLMLGRLENCSFYIAKGRYPGGNKRGCFLSESVLGDIIDRVEPDIASGVTVRLRFGHDGCLMALFAMLKLDGWNAELEDFTRAWEVWDVSQIPMASNLQLVFYRGRSGDLIFLPLLNEEPLALPLDALDACFYRWSDFVSYCEPIFLEAREALAVPPVPVSFPSNP